VTKFENFGRFYRSKYDNLCVCDQHLGLITQLLDVVEGRSAAQMTRTREYFINLGFLSPLNVLETDCQQERTWGQIINWALEQKFFFEDLERNGAYQSKGHGQMHHIPS